MIWFIVGLLLGNVVGFMACALMVIAKDTTDDDL